MPRYEFKYHVHNSHLDDLRRDILPYMDFDPHLANKSKKEYLVRSTYFDTASLLTYDEKESGVKNRLKFRIRTYDSVTPESVGFIEIKRKTGDFISKDRASIKVKNIEQFLFSGNNDLLYTNDFSRKSVEQSASNFLYYYYAYRLKPITAINYDREAFQCKFCSELRITFDKEIRTFPTKSLSEPHQIENMMSVLPDFFVLEIKFFDTIPNWLKPVLKKYNLMRRSASKYLMSVDVLNNNFYSFGLPNDRKPTVI